MSTDYNFEHSNFTARAIPKNNHKSWDERLDKFYRKFPKKESKRFEHFCSVFGFTGVDRDDFSLYYEIMQGECRHGLYEPHYECCIEPDQVTVSLTMVKAGIVDIPIDIFRCPMEECLQWNDQYALNQWTDEAIMIAKVFGDHYQYDIYHKRLIDV